MGGEQRAWGIGRRAWCRERRAEVKRRGVLELKKLNLNMNKMGDFGVVVFSLSAQLQALS